MSERAVQTREPVPVFEVKGTSGVAWYVEVQPTETVVQAEPETRAPPGTELIGAEDRLRDAIGGIAGMLETAAAFASDALVRHRPEELEIELNIGFTGTVKPVPFLVGAEANAAMKVKAKWKRDETK